MKKATQLPKDGWTKFEIGKNKHMGRHSRRRLKLSQQRHSRGDKRIVPENRSYAVSKTTNAVADAETDPYKVKPKAKDTKKKKIS